MDIFTVPFQKLQSLHASAWLAPATVVLVAYAIWSHYSRTRRIRRQGSRAGTVLPHKIPWGFDNAFRIFRSVLSHKLIEVQQDILKHGHVVEVNMAGSTMVFTDEPDNFRACMATKFSDFGKGQLLHDVFEGSMAEAIFCTDGDTWKRSRTILRPHCARPRPNDLEITESHFAHVLKQVEHGQATNVWDLVDRYQLDVASHVFFGKSTESLITNKQPFRKAMERLLKIASYKMSFGTLGTYVPEWLVAPSAMKELDKYVHTLYKLAQPQKRPSKPGDEEILMDSLAARQMEFKDFKAQVTAIMLGGKDPPALTMTWAIWELARNPQVYQRVRDEVGRVCGHETPPTRSQLKECHFIRSVVNEAMRLYHPLAINMKIALRDTSLPIGGGASGQEPLAILKGTPVVLSLWSLQRRPDLVGPDAHLFRPSRWESWTPKQWEFIPFNHGIRTCLGKDFGQEQVEYIIARIAQEFPELRIAEEQVEPMGYKFELNVKPSWPCLVRFMRTTGEKGDTPSRK